MASGSLQFQEPTYSPQARCGFCHQPVTDGDRTHCVRCRALYHVDCWKANDARCAVYGCDPPPAPPPRPAAPIPLRDRTVPSAWYWAVGAVVLLFCWGLASFPSTSKMMTAEQLESSRPRPKEFHPRLEQVNQVVAYCSQGLNKQTEGDLDAALDLYAKAIALNTGTPVPYHNRAVVRVLKGDLAGAEADYTEAIELDPNYQTAWRGRGYVRHRLGNLPAAMADLNLAVNLNLKDGRAYEYRGDLLYEQRDYDRALVDQNYALMYSQGREASPFAGRARTRRALGDLPGAWADLTRALELTPNSAALWHDRGHLATELEDPRGAIDDFTRALELDPSKPELLFDRACRRYELHAWEESLKDFEDVFRKDPESRDRARIRIFLIEARSGNPAEALRNLKAYIEQRDARPDGWTMTLLRFACGSIKEGSLLYAVGSGEQEAEPRRWRCEFFFLAGTLRLIAGDRGAAWDYFTECVVAGAPSCSEYVSAIAELRRFCSDD